MNFESNSTFEDIEGNTQREVLRGKWLSVGGEETTFLFSCKVFTRTVSFPP